MRIGRILMLGALALAGCQRPPTPPASPSPAPSITPVVVSKPATPQIPTMPRKPANVANLFNGLTFHTDFVTPQSEKPASAIRDDPASYQVQVTFTATLPQPSHTLEELAQNDPKLPLVLNQMAQLVGSAGVSPFYEKFYQLKIAALRTELFDLEEVLSRHNFYDCETILELHDAQTGRKALLMIADMDVNVDGSDGDRNVPVDGTSRYFQPQTSYRWLRQTERPNPLLGIAQDALANAKKDATQPNLSSAHKHAIQEAIEEDTRTMTELKKYSFLISSVDPFIVIPSFMLNDTSNPYAPKIGDYAVVMYEGILYPAIVGDAGPSAKMGEASLRISQQIDPKANAMNRPVNNLKVAYLIFPGTAEPSAPPDLVKWQSQCKKYLDELGGSAPPLFTWENLVPPWPTPTPSPTPSPTPVPSPTPSPSGSPMPSVSPTPASSPSFFVTPMPSSSPSTPLVPEVQTSTPAQSPAGTPTPTPHS